MTSPGTELQRILDRLAGSGRPSSPPHSRTIGPPAPRAASPNGELSFLAWHPNIQRGRTYDLQADEDGRRLWELVVERMELLKEGGAEPAAVAELPGGFTDPRPVRHRLGQGTFRALITDLYGRRCAVTREKALPTLEAAHIRPWADRPRHEVTNGLLLRSDVHRLFDAGYVTVTPEYRVETSRRMKDDFDDGDTYLKLHGARVAVPDREEWRPAADALVWHNERVYRG